MHQMMPPRPMVMVPGHEAALLQQMVVTAFQQQQALFIEQQQCESGHGWKAQAGRGFVDQQWKLFEPDIGFVSPLSTPAASRLIMQQQLKQSMKSDAELHSVASAVNQSSRVLREKLNTPVALPPMMHGGYHQFNYYSQQSMAMPSPARPMAAAGPPQQMPQAPPQPPLTMRNPHKKSLRGQMREKRKCLEPTDVPCSSLQAAEMDKNFALGGHKNDSPNDAQCDDAIIDVENDDDSDGVATDDGIGQAMEWQWMEGEEDARRMCQKSFTSKRVFAKHVNEVHIKTNGNFICHWDGCRRNEAFRARYMLIVHARTHTGDKPHVCAHLGCEKAYSRLDNLKTHQRTHTGVKPYHCKFTSSTKVFSNASDRAKHQNRTHSNEKPYLCFL